MGICWALQLRAHVICSRDVHVCSNTKERVILALIPVQGQIQFSAVATWIVLQQTPACKEDE